jgi:hypothetical protein
MLNLWLQAPLTPSLRIFQAFENAIAVMMALGGSTNGILHLLALAREAEVRWMAVYSHTNIALTFGRCRCAIPVFLCNLNSLPPRRSHIRAPARALSLSFSLLPLLSFRCR